jgi:SAM-dependent methyltransferase
MKRILINLKEVNIVTSKAIIQAIKFLPERKNTEFVFLCDSKNYEKLSNSNFSSNNLNDFNISFIESKNGNKLTADQLCEDNSCSALLSFSQDENHDSIPGFNEIVSPLLNIIYFAEKEDEEYYINDESILALSLNKLCHYFKEKEINEIMFLNSQISNFFEIETYIIERLEKDFKTIKTNLSDLKYISDLKCRTMVCLFPQDILSLMSLFLPSGFADIDHRYSIPCINLEPTQNETVILKQKIRYAVSQLIHLVNFSEFNPNIYAYKSFAEIYDHYMDHVTYNKWVDFILNHYQLKYKKKPETIFDLACGTGTISKILADRKFKVCASDQSPEMLDAALLKSEKIDLFQADMTEFDLENKADLIVLLFDSINYLQNNEQVAKLFQSVKNNLSDQGMLIFDISTLYNSTEYFDGFVNIEEYGKHFLVHRADYLPHKKRQETQLNIFTQSFLGYRREDEIHQQKVWKCSEMIEMIKTSGLSLRGIYDLTNPNNLINENPSDIDKEYSRIFFIINNE